MVIYWILFRFLPIRLLCVICYIVFTSFSFSTLSYFFIGCVATVKQGFCNFCMKCPI